MLKTLYCSVFLVLVGLLVSMPGQACSSCGNGGDDPLYLYPSESWKLYTAVNHRGHFKDVAYDGAVHPAFGAERRLSYVLASGFRVSPYSFFSLTGNYQQSFKAGRSVQAVGDPSLAWRYTLYRQNMLQPGLPQLQLLSAYKHSIARGTADARDPELLDVFGTGYRDIRAGVDLWSGMTAVQYGISFIHTFSLPERSERGRRHPGDSQAITLSLGKTWESMGKLALGLVQQRRFRRTIDSELIDHSEYLQHNIFVTFDGKLSATQALRLSYVREGAVFRNVNANQADAMTLAFMQVLQ